MQTIPEDEQKLAPEKLSVVEVTSEQLPQVQIEEPQPKKATPLLPLQELDEDELLDEVQREKEKMKEQEKEREKHRGREKDRERRRHKTKSTTSQSHSSSSPTSTTPSPDREDKKGKGKEHASRKGKDRTRSTKDKSMTYTSAYSSFSFPPREARVGTHIHTLGGRNLALEREREREAAAQAKDLVLAHRERDRAHARQTEAWQAEKDVRGTHKVRPCLFYRGLVVTQLVRLRSCCIGISNRFCSDAYPWSW